jgi:Carboxypeptidase regulatory-like domain/TonB dependent receptor
MRPTIRRAVLVVLTLSALLTASTFRSFSQSQSINGTIRGLVTDVNGSPISGARITVKNLDTGFTREVTSSSDGVYIAPDLPIGNYSVQTSSSGFAGITQTGVHLDAGSSATVDQQLKPGSVVTQVEVTGDAPIIENARFDLGRTISAEETQNLPLPSRNPYNFILFQPGISGHPNPENGIPRTLDTNGLVDRVNFQLDGMVDTETDRYGLRLFAISDSYVKEIVTVSNSYAPEFGNTAGVIYNSITGSGTNQYHGSAQYLWRPKAASSCPIINTCNPALPGGVIKPSLHVDDYVGNVGGPVIKDKFFFFVAYEHLKRANPTANTITAANQAALINLGVSPGDFATAGQVQYAQWLDVRGDWSINTKNQFFVRYNYFRNRYPFNTNVGGQYALSAAADFQDRAHIIGAQLVTTFSPAILNEFRGSWPYRNEHHVADPLTGPGPMVTISGIANFGGSNAVGDKFQEKIPSFNDNLTWIRGAHSMKFGVGLQKNLDTQLADVYTQYTFASIAQYANAKNGTMANVYSSVAASIGRPGAAYHSIFFNFFAQDTWQARKNLLLTYGLRYDQYRAPTPPAGEPFIYTQKFVTPLGNFSPRLGIAYSPNPSTVVRLNAGVFYEATPTNTWYNPLYNNGAAGTGSFIATVAGTATPGVCQPSYPNTPQNVPASCLPTQSIYALTPHFRNEYTWNANAQVAQQLAKNDSLTLGYIMTNGRNMQFLRNSNLINPTSFLADGRPVFATTVSATTRLYPQFNNITLIDTGSNSSYNAFLATYAHRMSAGLTTSASYTWSHAISNTPEGNTYEFSNPIEDPTNPLRDRGNSSINRPNSFTISAVYQPNTHFSNKFVNGAIAGNTFAFLGVAASGDEQTITVSPKLNGDGLATSRPLFVGRNTVRTPQVYQYDLRYTRALGNFFHERVQPNLIIEGTNLLNHSNVTSINTTATVVTAAGSAAGPIGTITTPPSLLPTSTLLEARILQFGLKIDF